MVRKYVLEPAGTNDAVGTGGTAAFSYLHEHISDTEAARVSVLKEGPTTPKSVRRSPGGLCPFFAAGRDAADAGEGLLVTNDDDLLWRVDAARGFLPSSEESASSHEVLSVVARLAREIPCSCATRGLFRSYVDAEASSLNLIDDGFVETLRLTDLERLRSRLAFVAAAYARGDAASAPHNRGPLKKTVEGDAKLSNALDQALGAASRRLGRPKRVLCLTDLVLCNRDLSTDTPPPSCRFLAVFSCVLLCSPTGTPPPRFVASRRWRGGGLATADAVAARRSPRRTRSIRRCTPCTGRRRRSSTRSRPGATRCD